MPARSTKSVKFTLSIAVHAGGLAKNQFCRVTTEKKRIGEPNYSFSMGSREDALSETKYQSRNYSGRALSRNITRNTNNRLALYYNRIRNIHITINIMRNTKNRIQEQQNDSDEISNLILAVITNYGYTILFVRVYKTLSDLA